MATAKTGSFYLTQTIQLPAGNPAGATGRVQAAIDCTSFVDAVSGQAIAIDEVDFLWQRDSDFGGDISNFMAANPGALTMQLTALNPGTAFVRGDDQSLGASGTLAISADANSSQFSDVYPDNFGPNTLSDMFLCVNDQLYLVAGNDVGATGAGTLYCTVRIRCRVVKLGKKDWIASALQSVATDN